MHFAFYNTKYPNNTVAILMPDGGMSFAVQFEVFLKKLILFYFLLYNYNITFGVACREGQSIFFIR